MEFIQGFWEAIRTGNLPDLGNWSYVLIALLVFLEGPSVTLVAGTMAATGILRAEWVLVAAVIGNFCADQFWYWLGRLGGHNGRLFRLSWFQHRRAEIEQLESGVQEHGVKMYLMAKLSMGLLSIPTLVSAGLMRVAWWRLAGVSILVEPFWTGFLVFAGYRLGEHIHEHAARAEGGGAGRRHRPAAGPAVVVPTHVWTHQRGEESQCPQLERVSLPMRVLFSGQSYYRKDNGQAVFMIRLAEGLVAAGSRSHGAGALDARRRPTRAGERRDRADSACPPPGPQPERNGLFRRVGGRYHRRLCARYHPHPGSFLSQSHGAAVARQRGIPIVGTNHFLPANWSNNLYIPRSVQGVVHKAMWKDMLQVYNQLDAATTPTETAVAILRKQDIRIPVKAISCGVDQDEFFPEPDLDRDVIRRHFHLAIDKPMLLYVGRVDREKGLDYLVEAAALLPSGSCSRWRLPARACIATR